LANFKESMVIRLNGASYSVMATAGPLQNVDVLNLDDFLTIAINQHRS